MPAEVKADSALELGLEAVQRAIRRFWTVVDLIKDANGRVKRLPYLDMNVKLQKIA